MLELNLPPLETLPHELALRVSAMLGDRSLLYYPEVPLLVFREPYEASSTLGADRWQYAGCSHGTNGKLRFHFQKTVGKVQFGFTIAGKTSPAAETHIGACVPVNGRN